MMRFAAPARLYRQKRTVPVLAFLLLCTVLLLSAPCFSLENTSIPQLELTDAERAYLEAHPTLRIAALDGAAPVISINQNGEIAGIAKSVTDRVEQMLGVQFVSVPTYAPREVVRITENNEADIMIIPANYAQQLVPDVPLTRPFLTAGTVLFYREDLRPNELNDKICVVVRGGDIPPGVSEQNVLYCDSRLESLRLVNSGRADYGYGNEFSIAYYAALKGYYNITTIPIRSGMREYCYGVIAPSPLLLSALDKAVASIGTEDMQTMILGASVIPERPLTFREAVVQFAVPLTAAALLILLGLISVVIYIYWSNRNLKLQNERLVILAEVSGDLMFEYEIKRNELLLSKQFRTVFHIPEQGKPYDKSTIAGILAIDDIIRRRITGEELTLPNGQYYRAVYSYIQGGSGIPLYLAGKLVDITAEKARIQALTNQARIDGLTNLLNSAESKLLVKRYLAELPPGQIDALLILDVDRFKHVNDTYGHYTGDQVLIQVASALRKSFRSQDVVGRLGGDEFIVYLHAVKGKEAVTEKCAALLEHLRLPIEQEAITEALSVSIGIYLVSAPESFDEAYQKADKALYEAKESGKGRFCIFGG